MGTFPPGTCRPGAIVLLALAALLLPRGTAADIIHLKTGGRIRCTEAWVGGDTVYYRIEQGVLGFPLSALDRIEPTAEAPEEAGSSASRAVPPLRLALQPLPEESSDPALQRARQAIEREDFEEVIRELSDETSFDAGLMVAYAYARLSNWPMTISALERFQVDHSQDAELNYLLGLSHYYLGHDEQAARYLKASLDANEDPAVRELLERLVAQRALNSSGSVLRTPHFVLRYEGAPDDRLARQILELLERDSTELQKTFSHTPAEEIQVVLTGRKQFFDITRAPEWSGGVNDGRIYLPIGGVTEIDDVLARALRHELAHTFVLLLTHGNIPVWLNEGICMYVSGERPAEYDPVLSDSAVDGKLVPLAALDRSFRSYAGPGSAELAYAESLAATDYLIGLYGFGEVNRLLAGLGAGAAFEEVLKERFHMSIIEFEKQVRECLLREAAKHPGEGIRFR